MNNSLIFIICFFACFFKTNLLAQRAEVIPYINFIKENQTHPVDYVFQLFEKYDIVILGERDHRDLHQYELVEKIISDRRFIENVGNIFTEIGSYNKTEWANQVLKGEYGSYDDFENNLRPLYREFESWNLIWEKYNCWYFLSSLYRINNKLEPSQKINLFFTDVPFDWNECHTREDWLTFEQNLGVRFWRDSIMGHNMITEYNKILNDGNSIRKKALVILNVWHANQSPTTENITNRSAASHIFNEYPGKVANVMINYMANQNGRNCFVVDGKWDAAFLALDDPSVGFDFKDSPLGMDKFDLFKRLSENIKYQDIFTGFIFYGGITSWNIVIGVPGIIDDDFADELMRRYQILFPNRKTTIEIQKRYYNVVRTYKAWDFSDKMSKRRIIKNYKYWIGKK